MGRRKAFAIGYILMLLSVALAAVSPSYYVFVVSRFLCGVVVPAAIMYYVLVTEVVGAPYRSLVAIVSGALYGLGYLVISGLAYLLPSWRTFVLAGIVLLLCFAPLFR